MKTRKIIAWTVVLVLLGGIGWFGAFCYRYVYVTVPNAYAVWWAADTIIDYLEAHDGAWPKGWDELQKADENMHVRVEIDWTADPHALTEVKPTQDGLPFRVIWLRNGSSVHWHGREPNRMIWEYLQERKKIKERALGNRK